MKNGVEDFAVESTPVLDLKKQGSVAGQPGSSSNEVNWDADRTEVYSDGDADNAVASLMGEHGEVFPITTFPYVIGRGSECDLVLQGKGVSRRHAEIIFQAGRFVVNDLESLNGIKVNGYKVSRVILEENDSIKLGEVNLTFKSGSTAAPADTARKTQENSKQSKTSKVAKSKAEKGAEVVDDTFGPSPAKKLITNLVVLVAVLMVGMAGYRYWQGRLHGVGQVIEIGGIREPVQSAPPSSGPNKVSANDPSAVVPGSTEPSTPAEERTVEQGQATEESTAVKNSVVASVDPPPSISPPPSIAKAVTAPNPVAPASSAKPVVEPVTRNVATKPVVSTKSASQQPSHAVTDQTVNTALKKAEESYFSGDAESAIALLTPYKQSSGLSAAMRKEVTTASENYSSLYNQYMTGQQNFSRGSKDEAFQAWVGFMSNEAAIFQGRKSAYAQNISSRVISEYVDLGNEAAKAGDNHKAYRMWQKALELGDNVAARIAIDNANNRAMQLYRQALRLEYVNTGKAKALWNEVTELLPPGTEYNTKASAKLAWYEKWGT